MTGPAFLRSVATVALLASLGACGWFDDGAQGTAAIPPARQKTVSPIRAIGTGPVKVGLILPLSGGGAGGSVAVSMREAAELALAEFPDSALTLLVADDKGTPDGARVAARGVLAHGAELILGPLFSSSVSSAASVAHNAKRPVIAFSTDVAAAGRGTYLLSFMPQAEVERVLDYAAAQDRRSIAALVPDTAYGAVVEAQFRDGAARRGLAVAAVERYAAGEPAAAVARLAPSFAGERPAIDALLIPDGGDGLPAVGAALSAAGFNPARVKPLGTGVWNDPRALKVAALQGGWFAAPDSAGFNGFATRYRAKFNAEPSRIATLAYDAVSLAAALVKTQKPATRFSDATLQSASGFAGADGVFRFNPDGTNERALAVLEVRNGATVQVSAAPRTMMASAN